MKVFVRVGNYVPLVQVPEGVYEQLLNPIVTGVHRANNAVSVTIHHRDTGAILDRIVFPLVGTQSDTKNEYKRSFDPPWVSLEGGELMSDFPALTRDTPWLGLELPVVPRRPVSGFRRLDTFDVFNPTGEIKTPTPVTIQPVPPPPPPPPPPPKRKPAPKSTQVALIARRCVSEAQEMFGNGWRHISPEVQDAVIDSRVLAVTLAQDESIDPARVLAYTNEILAEIDILRPARKGQSQSC